jgi:hypothetical protein
MSHSETDHHSETIPSHVPKKSYWEKELEKPSLKEAPLVSKWNWLKPLTVYHALQFRGLDKRDYYEPQGYDAWDHQAWNTQIGKRSLQQCQDYVLELNKCHRYLKAEFPLLKRSLIKRKDYCWKIQDNYTNCKRVYIRNNMSFVNDNKIMPEDH